MADACKAMAVARRGHTPKSWDQMVRFWWVNLVGGAVLSALALFVLAVTGNGAAGVGLLFPVALGCFVSGFFYNERLRQTGRLPLHPTFRRPDETRRPG